MTGELSTDASTGLDVAIVGMACRFPAASDVEALWRQICAGEESIRTFSAEELALAGVPPEVVSAPEYVRRGTVLEGATTFDASLFGITPREAELIDPQHRIFLELAWEALERAGYDPRQCGGPIGVFAGVGMPWYFIHHILACGPLPHDLEGYQIIFGNNKDHLATRVAYKLDLRGPAVTVQTACSSSLVSVHLACRALLAGECDLALAGGVSLLLPEKTGYHYQPGGVMSPDGHCRPFDALARGTVFGSGAGIVVLQRLDDALRCRSTIDALIKGSAINNDGARKVGYAAPSVDAQAAVIRAAHVMSEIPADTVGYVEAHGTGTALGDPIEVEALKSAFRASTEQLQFCALGSIKSNIGHLDTAAGVAGLIKSALCVKHAFIPPTLHFERPNPAIDFPRTPFYVPNEGRQWESRSGPRRAGVNSFGMGGTNAHVVLEEAPHIQSDVANDDAGAPATEHLIAISAASESALRTSARKLARYLTEQCSDPAAFADAAHTLRVGRQALPIRAAFVATSPAAAAAQLSMLGDGAPASVVREAPVVFLFPGQGSQHVGMAHELYAREPLFREPFDRCCAAFETCLGIDLRDVLCAETKEDDARRRLDTTELAQPTVFATSWALAKLWIARGVRPRALVGHSVGELVAATVASVFSLADAVRLVARRAQLMQAQPTGAMLSIAMPPLEVEPFLRGSLAIAAYNSASSCVVGGLHSEVSDLEAELRTLRIEVARLRTSHAFHTPSMRAAVEPFCEVVSATRRSLPKIPYLSNVTGTWITEEQIRDPRYWGKQLLAPVRFGECLAAALEREVGAVCLEVGPGRSLRSLVERAALPSKPIAVSSMRHDADSRSSQSVLLAATASLWQAGVTIDWETLVGAARRKRILLPTYPFERVRYLIEAHGEAPSNGVFPYRRVPTQSGCRYYVPVWKEALVRAAKATIDGPGQRAFVVVSDGSVLAQAIADRLRLLGRAVVVLRRPGPPNFEAACSADRAGSREGWIAMLDQASILGRPTLSIICMLTNGSTAERLCVEASSDVLSLYATLEARQPGRKVCVILLTQGAFELREDDPLVPEHAALRGLAATIPFECAGWSSRVLDVGAAGGLPLSKWAATVVDDLVDENGHEVTLRRGRRGWCGTFTQLETAGRSPERRGLEPGAAVVIVGGFGAIGRELGLWLAQHLKGHLLLTTKAPAGGAMAEQRAKHVRSLEALGAKVNIVTADARRAEDLKTALQKFCASAGRLDGVVFAAGTKSRHLLRDLSTNDFDNHATHRLQMLRALADALGDADIGFCAVVSSLASLLGGPGLAPYAAAHAAAEAFVAERARSGCPWVAVACDNWLTRAERGLAEAIGKVSQGALDSALGPDEGADAFIHAVRYSPSPCVVLTKTDLPVRLAEARVSRTPLASALPTPTTSRRSRPAMASDYVASRNSVEAMMVELWQALLGIDGIGVFDNFFELGGDSVTGLQFMSKLQQSGYKIDSRQIFEQPTISGLAKAARPLRTDAAELPVVGPLPLLPAQRHFLERSNGKGAYGHLVILEWHEPVDPALLALALDAIVIQHDALRCRFRRTDAGWYAFAVPPTEAPLPVREYSLDETTSEGVEATIRTQMRALEAGFDVEHGPLAACGLFHHPEAELPRVALLLHHLIIDAFSWRVLLEDLVIAYNQARAGRAAQLPPRTSSIKTWIEATTHALQVQQLAEERAFWLAEAQPLAVWPCDFPRTMDDNVASSTEVEIVQLSPEATERVLCGATRTVRADVRAVLLGALAFVLARWTRFGRVVIDVEGHGRTPLVDELDVSRTIGWFTATFPLSIEVPANAEPDAVVRAADARMRSVPKGGATFGFLAQAGGEDIVRALQTWGASDVSFLYLGTTDDATPSPDAPRRVGVEQTVDPTMRRRWIFEITASVARGELKIEWRYPGTLYRRETVQVLARNLKECLGLLSRSELAMEGPTAQLLEEAAEFGLTPLDVDAIGAALSNAEGI